MAVFFFQAEDGIRVDLVTGVQTCALPISIPSVRIDLETTMEDTHVWLIDADGRNRRELGAAIDNRQGEPGWSRDGRSEIGRASCRERVEVSVVAGAGRREQYFKTGHLRCR